MGLWEAIVDVLFSLSWWVEEHTKGESTDRKGEAGHEIGSGQLQHNLGEKENNSKHG